MMKFIKIPRTLYLELTPEGDERTELYRTDNFLLRFMFWRRLHAVSTMLGTCAKREECLDFGGGTGVMLPTLSQHFKNTTCVDLDAFLAKCITRVLKLKNVSVIEDNIDTLPATSKKFDAIVAADVLEHFKDLSFPARIIKDVLSEDGVLVLSLPTESKLYCGLRKVFNKKKPADHYHSADDVEAYLSNNGFKKIKSRCLPVAGLSLFSISAWKHA